MKKRYKPLFGKQLKKDFEFLDNKFHLLEKTLKEVASIIMNIKFQEATQISNLSIGDKMSYASRELGKVLSKIEELSFIGVGGSGSQHLLAFCKFRLVGSDSSLSFNSVNSSYKSGDNLLSLIYEILNMIKSLNDSPRKDWSNEYMKNFILQFFGTINRFNDFVIDNRSDLVVKKIDELLIAKEKVKVVQTFLRNGEILQLE